MNGRDKRRRARKLRERAEEGKSTKDLRVAVAPADLPHTVNTAAPDLVIEKIHVCARYDGERNCIVCGRDISTMRYRVKRPIPGVETA